VKLLSNFMDIHVLTATATMDIEIQALKFGKRHINESFSKSVELILSCAPSGRVVIMGMGKSGHIGNKIAATLASTGTPSFFVHPAEAGHGDLGMVTQADVVIGISQSGKSEELLRTLPYIKRNRIKLIAMTGDSNSPLAEHADVIIDTSVKQEACPLGLAPTASTTLTLALGDALAVCLLKAKGFTESQFAETHPHGTLGRKLLLRVSDVMSKIDEAPIIREGTSIRNTVFAMTKGGLGFVVVVDSEQHVSGVFTDGDLRRALEKDVDINNDLVADVMTLNFLSIQEADLAIKAIDLMEKNKISGMPVVNKDGRITGALNIRQLLQAGVI
jgi:arabinose-5-phosphate isomerase